MLTFQQLTISLAKRRLCYILLQFTVLLFVACDSGEPVIVAIPETVVTEIPTAVVITQPPLIVEVEVTRMIEIPITATNVSPAATPVMTPVRTDNVTPSPTFYKPHPYGTYTDILEVNEVARAVLTKNTAALRELVRFQPWLCIHENDFGGPVCNDDEPIGTEVQAFGYGYCEGFGTRDEEVIMSVIEELVARTTGVYAVVEDVQEESYGIVFTTIDNIFAITVLVEDEGISWVLFGCGQSPAEALAERNGKIILSPISLEKDTGVE